MKMCKRVPEDLEVGLHCHNDASTAHDVAVSHLPEDFGVIIDSAPAAEDASENVIEDSDSKALVVKIAEEDLEIDGVVRNNARSRNFSNRLQEQTSMLIAWSWTVLILPFTTLKKAFCLVKNDKDEIEMLRAHDQASVHDDDHPEAEQAESGNSPACEFEIGLEEIVKLVRDRSLEALNNRYNGVIGLSNLLKTNLKVGINDDDDEILHRRQIFGSNTYPCKKGKSFWCFIWGASKSPHCLVMMLATVFFSLLRIKPKAIQDGRYVEACNILAIFLDIIVRASTEYWQSHLFEKLTEEKRNVHLEVTRGGRRVKISNYDIVVGDIVPLGNGGQVPADGILFFANSLKIDEQELTGSHKIVRKDLQKDPFLLSGSKLIEGIGTMLVTSVGMNTKWGLKMESRHETYEEKPFQVYLKLLANYASWLVALFASVACIVQLSRYFSGWTKNSDGTPLFIYRLTTGDEVTEFVIKSLSFATATIIVAEPVGLSVAVLLNLANTKRKMMTDNVLVQTLSACERMGSVTTILCHKTGILTLNQMSVIDVWAGGIRMQDMNSVSQLPTVLKELIIEGIAQNTNGSVVIETGVIKPEVYGSPTEQAILSFGNKLGMKFDDAKLASSVHHRIPFNPKEKCGGVALEIGTQARVHWKGSAKIILSSCKEYMDGANNPQAIDEQQLKFFEGTIEEMCLGGMRCAALAYQPCERGSLPTIKEPRNLVLLAIIGIEDPCRPSTRATIEQCNSADVKVRMVTDDNSLTAQAKAIECGILKDASGRNIRTGAQFRNLSNSERELIAEDILVLAESSPDDHLLLVKVLQNLGHVVAATGMGIHDPKTLLAADVSLGMGIGGTAAAKENSDIIILDDDIATIYKVIQWCRFLYTNIQIYIQFRLTVSVSAVAICVLEIVGYDAFPLNVVQLLLLNFIIDIFGALALAYRPIAPYLMGKPPVGIRDPLITKTMWSKLMVQVFYVVLLLVFLNSEKILTLKHGHTSNAEKVMNTLIFISFFFCLAFSEFEIRSVEQTFKDVLQDNMFLIIMTSTVITHIIIMEFVGIFIPSVRLDLKKWVTTGFLGLLSQVATRFPFQAHQYYRN